MQEGKQLRNVCWLGARGGRDQFNWESVKSDKDREFYLGHSVKATTGRWQKGETLVNYLSADFEIPDPDRIRLQIDSAIV